MAEHQTDSKTIYIGYNKLKTKSRHDANFIITGGTRVVVMITHCAVNNKQNWHRDNTAITDNIANKSYCLLFLHCTDLII